MLSYQNKVLVYKPPAYVDYSLPGQGQSTPRWPAPSSDTSPSVIPSLRSPTTGRQESKPTFIIHFDKITNFISRYVVPIFVFAVTYNVPKFFELKAEEVSGDSLQPPVPKLHTQFF